MGSVISFCNWFIYLNFSLHSPSVVLDFTWQVHSEQCGSDHFPNLIGIVKSMHKGECFLLNL